MQFHPAALHTTFSTYAVRPVNTLNVSNWWSDPLNSYHLVKSSTRAMSRDDDLFTGVVCFHTTVK